MGDIRSRIAAWLNWTLFFTALICFAAPVNAEGNSPAEKGESPYTDVRPVLDRRCVTCHACYTAPCQLNLSHREGILRGASKEKVYDATRLLSAEPTRLHIDADSTERWHDQLGFFPVTEAVSDGNRTTSIMLRLLQLSRLSETTSRPLALDARPNAWTCPSNSLELTRYVRDKAAGMPYDLPALSHSEYQKLESWMQAGYPVSASHTPPIAKALSERIDSLEKWLNGEGIKQQLISRYLYEHLFLARLVDPEFPQSAFRLVRSRTPAGKPINEISTRRPFDDPGPEFHYRIRSYEGTRTHKDHIVFDISPERIDRIRSIFLQADWPEDPSWPGFPARERSNPFKMFADIPPQARYQFFLENARYFVMSFVRGPVCEGQVAVNVINDTFQVFFLAPEADLSIQRPEFLLKSASNLSVPPHGELDVDDLLSVDFSDRQSDYVAYRAKQYRSAYPGGMELSQFWSGQVQGASKSRDRNRSLTVMRHYDNASVLWGIQTSRPNKVWVIDYPIFERIYYLLVAGFDVFGPASHQAATRLYMDNLRIEAQQLYFDFLQAQTRTKVRADWNQGEGVLEDLNERHPLLNPEWETAVPQLDSDSHPALWSAITKTLGTDPKAIGLSLKFDGEEPSFLSEPIADALRYIASASESLPRLLPDLSYMLIETRNEGLLPVALVRDRYHTNVNYLFNESERYRPTKDRIHPVVGLVGSFPNLIFRLSESQLMAWAIAMNEAGQINPGTFEVEPPQQPIQPVSLPAAVTRSDPKFWDTFDELQRSFEQIYPVQAGLLDLSKYTYQLDQHRIFTRPEDLETLKAVRKRSPSTLQ